MSKTRTVYLYRIDGDFPQKEMISTYRPLSLTNKLCESNFKIIQLVPHNMYEKLERPNITFDEVWNDPSVHELIVNSSKVINKISLIDKYDLNCE